MGLIKSKLKRRLRKKHHLGEFQEFGFEIFFELKPNLNKVEFDKFYDDFIDEIERLKLLFGGGGGPTNFSGFITSAKRYSSPSKKQIEGIGKWLQNNAAVNELKISELRDAWYGWN